MAWQSNTLRVLVLMIVLVCGFDIRGIVASQSSNTTIRELQELPLSPPEPILKNDSVTALVLPRTIRWKEQEYDADAAIPILMTVINDQSTASAERVVALDRLGMLATHLRGLRILDDLVEFYAKLEKIDERFSLLQCLLKSQDSRSLPLLYSATSDKEPLVRLVGAAGLASWNVRGGVRQLIELFVLDAPGPRGPLGWEAVIAFDSENSRRAWGLPREVADRANASLKGLSDAELRHELQRRYSEWFEANKLRFPDWKPGDPLPSAEDKHPVDKAVP